MKGASTTKALLIVTALVALPATVFAWWWKDARFEVHWDADWPRTIRVTGEALEKFAAGPDPSAEVSEGDRARAAERARWKAYYYAQLRVAERLGELRLGAQTSISQLQDMDQELEASFDGTVRAAAEVESSVEYLDDSAQARVVVEIPADSLVSFRTLVAEALRSGRISIERRPPEREAGEPESPDGAADSEVRVADAGEPSTRTEDEPGKAPAAEPVVTVASDESAAEPAPDGGREPGAVPRPRPARAQPSFTGAAVFLGQSPDRLGPASVLYELGGAELGTVLDLPSGRLTAGFFPVATQGDAEAIHQLAGGSPRSYQATVSGRDLFLTESLASEEILRFRRWLRDGKIVLVLG